MWNELIACTVYVYAWEIQTRETHNADFAMSFTEYQDMLNQKSKLRQISFPNNDDNVNIVAATKSRNGDVALQLRKNKSSNDTFFDVEQQLPR